MTIMAITLTLMTYGILQRLKLSQVIGTQVMATLPTLIGQTQNSQDILTAIQPTTNIVGNGALTIRMNT